MATSLESSAPVPAGNVITRGLNAIFLEHRLPYALQVPFDRVCKRVGLRLKMLEADGLRFRVRRLTTDENFVQNIVHNHEYTTEEFRIGPDDIVIDVGGNIGTFAILAARAAHRGRVFSFEPGSENFRLLNENLKLNHVKNVVAAQAAVAGTAGEIELCLSVGDGGYNSTIAGRLSGSAPKETVRALTLQQIFDEHDIPRCDFLKMDCEGAEYDIVYSLPGRYWPRIRRVAMEFHGTGEATVRRDAARLVQYLEEVGFRIDQYEEHMEFFCGHIRATRA